MSGEVGGMQNTKIEISIFPEENNMASAVSSYICLWEAKVQLADTDYDLMADDGKLIIAKIRRFSGPSIQNMFSGEDNPWTKSLEYEKRKN